MKKILMIVGIVVLLAGAAFGGMMFGKKSAKATAPAGEKTVADEIKGDAAGKEGEDPPAEGEHAPAAEGEGHGEASKEGGEGEGKAAKAGPEDLTYQFETITTNLSDIRVFVQVKIELEAASPEGLKAIKANLAPLKDSAIMLLSSKTSDDLQSTAGLERFKRELMTRFEGVLNSTKLLRSVYLTDKKIVRN